MRKIVLMLALVAMAATAANAATYVWWQLEAGSSPACSAEQQGTPAGGLPPSTTNLPRQLIIDKPLHGPYDIVLGMYVANDLTAATAGTTCYRTSLWTGDSVVSNGGAYGTGGNTDGTPQNLNPMSWSGPGGNTINTTVIGPPWYCKLLDNFGKSRAGSETPIRAAVKVIQFTLHIAEATEAPGATHLIYQSVGTALFAQAPVTQPNNVYFGPNPYVAGATAVETWAGASAYLPVIKIIATPEPGTLLLLGLGLVGLIRRR